MCSKNTLSYLAQSFYPSLKEERKKKERKRRRRRRRRRKLMLVLPSIVLNQ
jgi:hypothetical protein